MTFQSRVARRVAAIATLLTVCGAVAAADEAGNSPAARAATLTFAGTEYVHRWSKDGQSEFTPPRDNDLARWQDMVTINVHESVRNGDQLADLANRVLDNYQKHGKIVRTDSKPRTAQHPAQHLIVAVLGNPNFVEAAFARLVLVDGTGAVAVYSHRVYGKEAGGAMSEWLKANGPAVENSLMSWEKVPSPAALRQLPQSK